MSTTLQATSASTNSNPLSSFLSVTPTLIPDGTGGRIVFPKTGPIPNGLLIDDQFIYYSLGTGNIMRRTLDMTQSLPPEEFAKIQYPSPNTDGTLRAYPRLLKNDWLFFIDAGDGSTSDKWILRAIHTNTRSEKIIAKGNGQIFGFSVDGDTIAISFSNNENLNCTEEYILETISFSTGYTNEVARSCGAPGYHWSHIALSGEHLLAIQYPLNGQAVGTYIFDLRSYQSELLSKALHQPHPVNCDYGLAVSGPWIACNVTDTATNLYNLTTNQILSFTELSESEMSHPGVGIQDHYLYWTGHAKGKIYCLDQGKMFTIVTPKTAEFLREMVVYGTKVAWLMLKPSGYVLGWTDIPQN